MGAFRSNSFRMGAFRSNHFRMGALAQFMVHQDRQETVPVTVVPTNNLPIKNIYENKEENIT